MMQEHSSKQTTKRSEDYEEVSQAEKTEQNQQLNDDIDELLDEIDGVLEENAEEWVRSFVQKGGQ